MAREISVIQQSIIDNLVARAAAAGLVITPSEWSDFDYRQLLTYVAAAADGTLEQNFDAHIEYIEGLIAAAVPQTPPWFQAQMLLFQFDATDPQVLEFNTTTFAPAYPAVNTAFQVIKYCSVVPGIYGTTLIKVAAEVSGAPADLDTAHPGALAAAQSYVNLIAVPGLIYNVVSGEADKLFVEANVYYQGAYSAIIQANVEEAITAYLAGIPFDGVVLISNLETAIKAVEGVNDVVFTEVRARADATIFASGTALVLASTLIQRKYATSAGYIIPETDSGHTLADSITYIAE
jgi:hypothetical protein